MDQTDKGSNGEEEEKQPNQSFNVHNKCEPGSSTVIGDHTTLIQSQDCRTIACTINVYPKLPPSAILDTQNTGVYVDRLAIPGSTDDVTPPYEEPVRNNVMRMIDNIDQIRELNSKDIPNTIHGDQNETADVEDNLRQESTKAVQDFETPPSTTKVPKSFLCNEKQFSERSQNKASFLLLADKVVAFCNAKSESERKKLTDVIHVELNDLSVNFSVLCPANSTICRAEFELRSFLLQDDIDNVIYGIGIYASILNVMLQHGLQPKLCSKGTFQSLSSRLKRIVEPPNFMPMSRVRRDIDTVAKMLSAFTKIMKEEKLQKAILLIKQINKNASSNINGYIKKYLDIKSWTQQYLVLFWLKIQVLVLKKEELLFAFLQVIEYLTNLLDKMKSSCRWKFTITVVDSLSQIINEISEPSTMRDKSIAGLSRLFDVLQEKKLDQCIDIFQQRARSLVFIDNLAIRSVLLNGIFKKLDTASEEMSKERIKFCERLQISGSLQPLHPGTQAWIFSTNFSDSKVIVKCYKKTRKEFIAKDANPHLKHFDYECEFLCRLKHPNVVSLLAYDEHAQCLVLEPVSKGSLLKLLWNHRVSSRIPKLMTLLSYAVQILGALEYLKHERIIHLAMQARNVLLHDNGTAKLTGFQFCRTLEQIDKTGVKEAVEKSHFKWMDPQALLYENISPTIVSWSFGVFLYELLTLGCVPFNHFKSCQDHGDFERGPLTSSEARIFVIRGGKLEKESCIPEKIFSIISEKCLQKDYSLRASPTELKEILQKQLSDATASKERCRPPPDLIRHNEDRNSDNYNPGTDDFDDDMPFAHLEVVDDAWNKKYDDPELADVYSNADPSQLTPFLCIIKPHKQEHRKKDICILEYMEFKDIKLVKKLQKLNYPELVKVVAVNPFGPDQLEMISESYPKGNVLDVLLLEPMLRKNFQLYILQAGKAVTYLHEHGIVHRDIKIDNYLMENDVTIKLGRLGLSTEEVDVNAEYSDPRDLLKPKIIPDARRNAPEVLSYHSYTRKSDVWSYGVVVWEFLKLANSLPGVNRKDVLPYSEVPDNEVSALVMNKKQLSNPDPNSSTLYDIYRQCWEWDAKDRPFVSIVFESLEKSFATRQYYSPYCDVRKSISSSVVIPGSDNWNAVPEETIYENTSFNDSFLIKAENGATRNEPYEMRPPQYCNIPETILFPKSRDTCGPAGRYRADKQPNEDRESYICTNQYEMRGQYVEDVGEKEDLYELVDDCAKIIVSKEDVYSSPDSENYGHDILAVSTKSDTPLSTNEQLSAEEASEQSIINEQEAMYDDVYESTGVFVDEVEENSSLADDFAEEISQDDIAFNIGCEGHVKNLVAKFSFKEVEYNFAI